METERTRWRLSRLLSRRRVYGARAAVRCSPVGPGMIINGFEGDRDGARHDSPGEAMQTRQLPNLLRRPADRMVANYRTL